MEHLPYKGAGPVLTDVLAGHLRLGTTGWSTALGQIRAGGVVPIATSSRNRFPGLTTCGRLPSKAIPNSR